MRIACTVSAPQIRLRVESLDVIGSVWCRACGVFIAYETCAHMLFGFNQSSVCTICEDNRLHAR